MCDGEDVDMCNGEGVDMCDGEGVDMCDVRVWTCVMVRVWTCVMVRWSCRLMETAVVQDTHSILTPHGPLKIPKTSWSSSLQQYSHQNLQAEGHK